MTLFGSKFDITTEDPHPNAQAGLMISLDVDDSLLPSPLHSTEGTPVAGSIPAGAIVYMNPANDGKALLGDGIDVQTNDAIMYFVTVDGDQDFDGAGYHRITCIQGGCRITTDQFAGAAFSPGEQLTVGTTAGLGGDVGKFILKTDHGYDSKEQCYGFVGPEGYDATNGTLDVIIPQGV
jgi:hypothetical protein